MGGGYAATVKPWSLQLECYQLPCTNDCSEEIEFAIVVDEVVVQDGVPSTPEAGVGMRNSPHVNVGTTFNARVYAPPVPYTSEYVLVVEELPWGRGDTELR